MFVYGVEEGAHEGVIDDSILDYGLGSKYPGDAVMTKRIDKVLASCMPSPVSLNQMALITSKFLETHPESLTKPASSLVLDAFSEAWPCSKVKN
ncbi:MAG: Rap1a/Tai family immunity protein [Gammaproteobacteria bacterium]